MSASAEKTNDLNISSQLQMTVYSSLMAALIAVGAFIAVPVGPVPIVLQNLFVMLAALLLGRKWGLASIGLYLLAGICGLPVFSGGGAGLGHFFGPTGGYLIGYIPAAFVIGFVADKTGSLVFRAAALIAGAALVYLFGVSWLKIATGMTLAKTMAVGMLPFLIGDAVKIVAALFISKALHPVISKNRLK
ncbi:biotin transporter BioY [Desulfopila sp. IMCC35008]|uniref:biotin transporter BioY n=1 Tax=Desulfopila sp. IMCC35008 TaxID=2653858 RepID=UPI0013D6AF8D|nr:biotin transporter BioY [Desulfopila sp. IMCC35008]